jgi:hypothetical protein
VWLPLFALAGLIFGGTQLFRVPGIDLPEGTVPDVQKTAGEIAKQFAPWVVGGLIAWKVLEKKL